MIDQFTQADAFFLMRFGISRFDFERETSRNDKEKNIRKMGLDGRCVILVYDRFTEKVDQFLEFQLLCFLRTK